MSEPNRWYGDVVDDAIDEPDETFNVLFSAPSGASWTGPTTHTVTIVDNDPPAVLSIASVSVPEAAGAAVFTVKRTGQTALAVQVNYQTGDGTALVATNDYQARSGTVTIPPGGASATQPISVAVTNDAWAEPPETDLLGSRSAVLRQLSSEVARSFLSGQLGQGGPFNEVYHLNGYMVRVTGAVVNGAPRISNAWVLRRMGT